MEAEGDFDVYMERVKKEKNELYIKINKSHESHKKKIMLSTSLEAKLREEKSNKEQKEYDLKKAEELFLETQTIFYQSYPKYRLDLQDQPRMTSQNLKLLEGEFYEEDIRYTSNYIAISKQFEETREGHDLVDIQIKEKTYAFNQMELVLLGPRIGSCDYIAPYLQEANNSRISMMDDIRENMMNLFSFTQNKYEEFRRIVRDLNVFFKGLKISNAYFLNIKFEPHKRIQIDILKYVLEQGPWAYRRGELPIGQSVQDFVEDFFKQAAGLRESVKLLDLLNPKTYFELSVTLTDEHHNEIPGSTGETYSAITLLGIARLSKVQAAVRKGIKFIILEESANLDNLNFNTFPRIAKEYGYQIITMTPKPYSPDTEEPRIVGICIISSVV